MPWSAISCGLSIISFFSVKAIFDNSTRLDPTRLDSRLRAASTTVGANVALDTPCQAAPITHSSLRCVVVADQGCNRLQPSFLRGALYERTHVCGTSTARTLTVLLVGTFSARVTQAVTQSRRAVIFALQTRQPTSRWGTPPSWSLRPDLVSLSPPLLLSLRLLPSSGIATCWCC